jgi:hypothetical protein
MCAWQCERCGKRGKRNVENGCTFVRSLATSGKKAAHRLDMVVFTVGDILTTVVDIHQ